VISVPILLSLSAGALITWLVFGTLQGVAFGFGMTMLGVTVDYPVLMIGHRKRGEAPAGTVARIGSTLLLTVAAASIGLLGMLGTGFPGLEQIGVFSIAGVLVAGLASRFLLPHLIASADLAPVEAGDYRTLLRLERLRGIGWAATIPAIVATLFMIWCPPHWGDGLAQMNAVPAADQRLDAEMRKEAIFGGSGQIAVVQGRSAEDVLETEERVGLPAVGFCAARLLPSAALQTLRQQALPDQPTLKAAIATAAIGLPFKPDAFASFEADVALSRSLPPLHFDRALPAAMRLQLDPMLFLRDHVWYGLGMFSAPPPSDFANHDVMVIAPRHESEMLLMDATSRALRFLSIGAVACVLLLATVLRDKARLVRVVACVTASTLVTVAILDAIGNGFSLLHIVALQFVAGVGLDYALFFSRRNLDAEERARTFRTLITCNAMTLLTFGLLATCQTNLLRQIGLTITIGAVCAMIHAFLLGRPAEHGAPTSA
jgi:predicted exporter